MTKIGGTTEREARPEWEGDGGGEKREKCNEKSLGVGRWDIEREEKKRGITPGRRTHRSGPRPHSCLRRRIKGRKEQGALSRKGTRRGQGFRRPGKYFVKPDEEEDPTYKSEGTMVEYQE